MGRRFAVALGLLAGWPAVAQDCPPGRESVRVEAVTARLEIRLADGRLLRLAGLEAPPPGLDPALSPAIRAALSEWLEGGEARFEPVSRQSDRWGRIAGRLSAFHPEEGAPVEAGALVAARGGARVSDPAEAGPCRAALLAAEARGRERRLGLWADPDYAVAAAEDRAALAQRAGFFAVVEGRIRRVAAGRTRIFLDFGPTRADFTASLPARAGADFRRAGIDPARLAGRRVRLRGFIDLRAGRPSLDLHNPAALELLDAPAP